MVWLVVGRNHGRKSLPYAKVGCFPCHGGPGQSGRMLYPLRAADGDGGFGVVGKYLEVAGVQVGQVIGLLHDQPTKSPPNLHDGAGQTERALRQGRIDSRRVGDTGRFIGYLDGLAHTAKVGRTVSPLGGQNAPSSESFSRKKSFWPDSALEPL